MALTGLLLSVALSLDAAGAIPLVHDRWGTKEGLPQSSVTAILQTSDGYLWLGTQGGLVRFDGVRFELFSPSTHRGLSSSRISALLEDRRGTLWIGTEDGGLVSYDRGVFAPFAHPLLSTGTIRAVAAAPDDGLWIAAPEGLVEIRAGTLTRLTRADGSTLLPSGGMVDIAAGASGELWIGTREGLVRYTPTSTITYTAADGLPDTVVMALLPAPDGSLWVGTQGGLAQWLNGRVSRTYRSELTHPEVRSLHDGGDGTIWVGTRTGLDRLSNGRVTAARPGLVDSIIAIASDREGSLWVGTVMSGLSRLRPARVTMLRVSDRIGAAAVGITQDRDGTMWIAGTCTGLLRVRDGERRMFTTRDGLPGDCVWSLLADRDGALWVGTFGGGLARMAGGEVQTFTHRNSGLLNDVVLALFQDRDGRIWVGTQGGLHVFAAGRLSAYRMADGLVNDDVRFITQDRGGALWIATTGGISRFAGGRFTNYTTANGLPHNAVRAIHEDSDGAIWIGTYGGGLARLKQDRFSHITRADGLFDDVVSRILDDGRGFLWMTGNHGIFRASRQALNDFADGRAASVTSVSYDTTDGMTSHETSGGGQPAGWQARDGRLWFPTIDGVAIIDPAAPDNTLPPPLAIEHVRLDNRELDPAAPIVLPSGRMQLAIEYTGLSLAAPGKTRFRYQLEGYEDTAVEAGARRVAYYTSLPPGTFTFRVTGSNSDGAWNRDGATLAIQVTAPFWMTWWFRGVAGLAVAAAALTVHRARVARLTKEQHVREAFTRHLIESQEAERARVARELHDTLGQSLVLIKSQALLGLGPPSPPRTEAMTEIAAMATQAIAEVKEIAYDLRPYQLDRLGVTKALEALIARVSGSTTLQLNATIANIDGLLSKEAEITLYRIVQESLNNIVKHAEATVVAVEIADHAGGVRARIHDNGRGFTVSAAPRPSGLGLSGMAERARMLNAQLTVASSPGHGTTVTLTIPEREARGR
jgi:signal transduction histidine kinase/ligand-binding sensor domain-containing protein